MAELIEQTDIVFGHAGARALHVDTYRPAAGGNGAAVLIVHGGGWSQGSKAMVAEHARHLARDGFVVLASQYRLTPEAHWPAQIHDVRLAIRWARIHAAELGFDPDKLCLEGHSAGAHLVLLAAGAPDEPSFDPPGADTSVSAHCAAVVAVYPPVLMYRGDARPSGGTPARALPGAEISDEVAALASPINHVAATFPPTLLLHGDADRVVPVSASRRFETALRDAGGRVDLHIFSGLPHGLMNHPHLRPVAMTLISGFFHRQVAAPLDYVFAPPAATSASSPEPAKTPA